MTKKKTLEQFVQEANIVHGNKYQTTIEREKLLKDAGFTVISIWEKDFDMMVKMNRSQNRGTKNDHN